MRLGIGTPLILLIIALISLGFLLSDDIDTHQELSETSQLAGNLARENKILQDKLNVAIKEIETLNDQIDELSNQILFFQNQARQAEEQNQKLQERNVELEKQVVKISSDHQSSGSSPITNPNFAGFALLFPVAIAATYIVTRYQAKNIIQKHQVARLSNKKRGTMVKLSDEELKEVIKMRRGQ